MNREEIIRMAREAHTELMTKDYPGHMGQLDPWTVRLLERFAALVAAAEREACAKVCDRMAARYEDMRGAALESAAESIRLRGQA